MAACLTPYPPTLDKPLRTLMKVMNFIIITSGCIMACTFFFVVIFRYGFGADLFAYEEWLMTIAFWMFFIASAAATHDRSHVNADIVGFMIDNPRIIWLRTILVEVLELAIVAVVTYWGFLMCLEELQTYPNWQATIALKIPFLVPRVGIFVGFLLMMFYSALHLYCTLQQKPQQDANHAVDQQGDGQ